MRKLGEYFLFSICLLLLCSCITNSIRIAEAAYKDEDYDKAVEEYLKIIQKSKKSQYKYNLALSYLAQDKELEALTLLENLLEKYSENILILRTKLVVLYALKRYEESQSIVLKLFSINPNNFYAYLYSFYLLCEEKQCEKSLLGLKILYRETRNPRAMLAISEIAEKMFNFREAVFWLNRYTQEVPQAKYFFKLADWNIEKKDYLAAINSLKKGLDYHDDPKERYKMAYIYLIFLSNPKQGIIHLDKAVEQGFNSQKDFRELLTHSRLGNRSEVEKTLYKERKSKKEKAKKEKSEEEKGKEQKSDKI